MRQRSVLWWATQPPQPYIVVAVLAPVSLRSRIIEKNGVLVSVRLHTSEGQ